MRANRLALGLSPPNGSLRFRCRACGNDFTLTSGTLFASHKLPLRTYLAAIAIFCNEVKGKSALAISRDLGVSYKPCFVLLHKLREAMGGEMKDRVIGGPEKVAETDGAFFGGYIKPSNLVENRRDRRLPQNQSGKRKCVIIVRERGGNSVPAVFKSESHAANFIKSRVAKGTTLNADQAAAWDGLHKNFEMARIDHGHPLQREVRTTIAEGTAIKHPLRLRQMAAEACRAAGALAIRVHRGLINHSGGPSKICPF
jgi:hypothetical protein